QVRMAALGAFGGNGAIPGYEIAVGVADTAVESLAAAGAALGQLASAAFLWAGNTDGLLLDVLALGVIAARGEFAEAAVLDDHVVAALRTLFLERDIGFFLLAAHGLGSLAIRVAGAGVELAEAPFLQRHGPAAVLAIFFFAAELGEVVLVDIGEIDG